MSLGQVIKQKRLEQGLSQEDLAIKVGVAKAMIGQVERGKKMISVPLYQEIVFFLYLPRKWFYSFSHDTCKPT